MPVYKVTYSIGLKPHVKMVSAESASAAIQSCIDNHFGNKVDIFRCIKQDEPATDPNLVALAA